MLSLKFKTINPATEGIINEYENMTYEHLDSILMNAKNAFVLWKEDFKKRADEFLKFVRTVQKKAQKRGLTEKKLKEILNDHS